MLNSNMNRIRIIILTIVLGILQGLYLPVAAQSDPKATKEAINYVIRKVRPATAVEPLAEELCKKFKNHPEVAVAIGEAFYRTDDSLTAKKYLRRVIQEHPNYIPAYITAGDWAEETYHAYDEAMDWYDQAIKANPKDSSGYIRYAKVLTKLRRPAEAAEKIKEITKHVPDFPVNLQIARIYSNLGKITEAVEFYGNEKLDNLDSEDIKDYATDCYLKHQYQKSLDIAKYGFEKYPRSAPMSRLAMYNCVELKDFKNAVMYGEHLLYKTEEHKTGWQDQYYMALAYQGANQTGKAIEWFRKSIVADSISEGARNNSYRQIVNIYKDLGEYDKASETYDQLYKIQKAEGRVNAQDINLHARLFLEQSTEVNGAEVFECYRKANALYELMAQEAPNTASVAYFNIMQNYQRMDPKFEQGLSLAPAQRLIDLLKDKADISESEKRFMAEAYWTLCYYHATTKPVKKALVKKYGTEILRLLPDDQRPQRVFSALNIK